MEKKEKKKKIPNEKKGIKKKKNFKKPSKNVLKKIVKGDRNSGGSHSREVESVNMPRIAFAANWGKIKIFTTGGTIAMMPSNSMGGLVPAKNGKQLLNTLPDLGQLCRLELVEFSNVPSPHVKPSDIFRLSKLVSKALEQSNIDGVVITHGTDTLEESAYLMSLITNSEKPIVFTAAMKPGASTGSDGPSNIISACKVAVSREAKGHGVVVVMNEEIHTAREVRKTYTSNVATFNSPGYGPIGLVDEDRVIFLRKSLIRQKFSIENLETSVELIKTTEGCSDLFINAAIDSNVKGLVLEGFGRGDVPPNLVPAIKRALRKGVVIVMTSRCFLGRVLGVYGYRGGGKELRDMGVIFSGDLSGPKARIKLMVALATTYDVHKLTSIFELEDISWG